MDTSFLARRAAALVAAYVSHDSVPTAKLPSVIGGVHAALRALANGAAVHAAARPSRGDIAADGSAS